MWNLILPAAASVVGGLISGSGAKEAGKIQAAGADRAAELQYRAQQEAAARNEPFRQSGANALNFQNQWLGLPQVNTSGNPLAMAAAPGSPDYASYVRNDPQLMAEFSKPGVAGMFGNDLAQYGQWHASTFGDRQDMPTHPAAQGQAAGQTGQGGGVMSTIKSNPLWVAATQGFMGVNGMGGDVQDVNAAFSAGGKQLSGAQTQALHDRSTARSYNALSDIYNQYAGMSGTGFSATQNTNQNALSTAANMGNAAQNAANARSSGYSGQFDALKGGISGALGHVQDYGQKNWGW